MTAANTVRNWLIGGLLALLVLAALLWLVLVGPEFDAAASTRASAADAAQQGQQLQAHVDQLRAQQSQLPALRQQLSAARAAVPSDSGADAFTRELSVAAAATHVKLTSISVGTPAAMTGAGGQVTGVFTLAVSVVTTGEPSAQFAFLHALQNGARAALVTGAALAPPATTAGTTSAGTTMTVSLTVFADPGPGVPVPSAPTATGAATR